MKTSSQQACIVGVGETAYAKWGQMAERGEWSLACEAVLTAVDNAGLAIDLIDGLASFSNDSSLPWLMQQALGLPNLGFTSMVWGGGGSGTCGALAHAAMAHWGRTICRSMNTALGTVQRWRDDSMSAWGLPRLTLTPYRFMITSLVVFS